MKLLSLLLNKTIEKFNLQENYYYANTDYAYYAYANH